MLGQLGSQGFAPGAAPAAFNMSFLPQQILQDAYAMSTPVEAADEPFLLTKLLASRRKGESYKDALNSIHGVLDSFSCLICFTDHHVAEQWTFCQSLERLLFGP